MAPVVVVAAKNVEAGRPAGHSTPVEWAAVAAAVDAVVGNFELGAEIFAVGRE